MFSPIATIALFAAATSAISDSQPLPTEVVNRINANVATGIGGALDFPRPTEPAKIADAGGANDFTVTIINGHTAAITSIHVESDGSNLPVGGRIAPGVLDKFKLTSFVVPRDYFGNIAFNEAGYRADTGDESLIELSFRNQNGIYTPDIDVSYVDGFSVPISCLCNGDAGDHTSGCSKNLWDLHSCPDNNGQGSCRNPRRYEENNHTPTEFFAPCHHYGGAYTYPDDSQFANTLNGDRCRGGLNAVTCCVGTVCSEWEDYPR